MKQIVYEDRLLGVLVDTGFFLLDELCKVCIPYKYLFRDSGPLTNNTDAELEFTKVCLFIFVFD